MKWNKLKRIATVALAGVLLAGSFAGCGSSKGTSASAKSSAKTESTSGQSGKDKATRLNIAYQTSYYPIYVMKREKTLDKALKDAGYDLKITYTLFESGPPENESFASGQQDIGVLGNVPGVSGIASGQNRKIIGTALHGEKTNGVLVKKGSTIKTAADLKGKKVGLVIGSNSENLLYNLLQKSNIKYDDVKRINLAPGEQEAALTSGQVDAIVSWDPTLTTLVRSGEATEISDGSNGLMGIDPIVVDGDYLDQNPDIVRIFLQEYKKAAKVVESDRDKFSNDYADEVGVKKDDFKIMVDDITFPPEFSDAQVKDLQNTADFLYATGLIKSKINIADYAVIGLDKEK